MKVNYTVQRRFAFTLDDIKPGEAFYPATDFGRGPNELHIKLCVHPQAQATFGATQAFACLRTGEMWSANSDRANGQRPVYPAPHAEVTV